MRRRRRAQPLRRRPSVTVVIPCYNYGRYLSTALKSVLDQPEVDVDAIVIDDASPDGSAEVVRELAGADSRIRAILHARNLGHIATYNEGLEQASGDYVVLLSADDALTPGALARATALLEAHPSVGLVYGANQEFLDDPPPVTKEVRNWTLWRGNEWMEKRCRSGTNCIASPEVVMRTSVQHAIGGYDASLPHSGDLEMWLRAAAVSDVGRVNGPPQAYYRVHPKSMMRSTYPWGSPADLEQRLSAFENVLVGPKASVPNGVSLFSTARKSLAGSALKFVRSAYDHGRSSEEPVAEYMAFAVRVCPELKRTRRWRALVRCAAAGDARLDRGWGPAARRVEENLRQVVRRWRWRWSGA